MFFFRHNKTSKLLMRNTSICRFLSEGIAILLFWYIAYLLPLSLMFQGKIYTPGSIADGNQFLCFKNGHRIDGDQYGTCFASVLKSKKLPLGIAAYRQVVSALMRRNFKLGAKASNIIERQAGHSEKTDHELYGRSDQELLEISAESEYDFFIISKSWQALIFQK